MNALAFIALIFIQDTKANNLVQEITKTPDFQEITLKASLMVHSQSTYNLIAQICFGLMVINIVVYRQWVKSKRWLLEPILILIISYALTFTLSTYQTFEMRDELMEEGFIKK